MSPIQRLIAEKIYGKICSTTFARWYGYVAVDHVPTGDFDKHIRREELCPTKEQILEQIVDMFEI